MFYRKSGYPNDGELVICTVKTVHYNSVFVNLDEYDLRAMLHISEVSPGRIRNIRDYVKEGKIIICVILKVNKDRNLIDVSLRRVNDGQRRKKLSLVKHEQMSEKIVEFIAKEKKLEFRKLYDELTSIIFEKYASLYECFEQVVVADLSLEKLGIKPELAKQLNELIRQRIKPPEVMLSGKIFISTYKSDGVEVIKTVLGGALALSENASIRSLGAGAYKLDVKAEEYKTAEKILDQVTKYVEKEIEKYDGSYSFERMESD
ncbi:S1 RNA-binding domain-containing protein [Candidatus Woesearchaeota archaeon]|jgi:translation initiation factor 2 subunit 1|nr:S1 RNA-binding domain-containing protein [Candidatus Woesearchaeota archaeon]MBT5272505.1 S1 RNA-binding domain-containing protein [Candidatus Woesearchaeota archaeon]MBT6041487.1 S1 RNA-binding domain-containing protein [Candidatus Woesearchaeota archaeon]MBT6336367.1 S1 RNA-binding domain-containing protein [Candidatus Woesearchaeota archaeon]MBT7928269.1 S1 RNA-binding domain-containing protein [Candidatus Woesearchaeota archaeon]